MHEPILPEVVALADALRTRGWRLATAESCTGGLIAAACTALAGSSDWFERGVVSYSNAAKTELLGVPAALIAAHGAVSEPVARAMAEGVLARSSAELAIAVTGIAGPGGAVPGKPVGTVWLGWGRPGAIRTECLHLTGDRGAVRQATVVAALARALGQALAEAAPTIPASSVHPGSAPGTMPDDAPDITLNHASNPAPNPAPDRTPGRTA